MTNIFLTIRKCILGITLILGTHLAICQLTFNKMIDFNYGYESLFSIKTVPEGYILLGCGLIPEQDYWQGLKICKTDLEGSLIWQHVYCDFGSNLYSGYNVISDIKDNLYLTGSKSTVAFFESNLIFVKFNGETGDTLFLKEYYQPGFEAGFRLCWLPDSTILIFGNTGETGNRRIRLMNLDTLGNVIYNKYYGTGIMNDFRFFQLDESGEIYLSFGDDDCDPRGYYFYTLDYSGNIQEIYNADVNCLEWGVPSLTDDGFYIASYDYYIYLSTFFAKLNSDYSYAWKNYFEPDGVYNLWAQYELVDGSIIVYGSKEYEGVEITYHAFLRKIDKNGITIWEREYFTEKEIYHSYIWTISETPDKGFICGGAGYGEPSNEFGGLSQNFWLLKLDSMGCLIPGCDTIDNNEEDVPIESNNSTIIVYPNPITTEATIQIDLAQLNIPYLTYFEIELTDLHGRILTEFTVDQFHWVRNGDYITLPLNRENWARGIYFIQIKAESKIIGNQKIVFQ